jgi:hypothetical protein
MEVIAWETELGFAVHLLNYNGPNAFRGRMRKFVSLGEQSVRVRLPDGKKIATASLLRGGSRISFRQNGNIVELKVPSIKLYEVVALET